MEAWKGHSGDHVEQGLRGGLPLVRLDKCPRVKSQHIDESVFFSFQGHSSWILADAANQLDGGNSQAGYIAGQRID